MISKRYEKSSIILTSNKTFSKAHMFRLTCARCCRSFTGSSGGRDGYRHCVGDQRDQLLRPAIRLLGGDFGSAGIADEVGAVQAVESAASVEAPTVRVSGHPRDVVGIEDEHVGVRADRIRAMRHQRWQKPVPRGFLCYRRRHRHFPEAQTDSLVALQLLAGLEASGLLLEGEDVAAGQDAAVRAVLTAGAPDAALAMC